MKRLRLFALPFALLAAPLAAEDALPDAASVATALDNHPSVTAARARADAARAEARALAKGPHEVLFSGSYVNRNVRSEGAYDEFDTQLTRAVRLPGKARLDRAIGRYGVEAADNMAEDAKHQAALKLAEGWWDWVGAGAQAAIDAQAVDNYRRALAAVQRRIELHDAALLEADQAAAALAAAEVLAAQSSGRAQVARSRLAAQFPSLALPQEAPVIPGPEMPAESLEFFRGRALANSHEIAAAEAIAQQREAMAERARKDRIADPTFGVRLFSERGGAERGAGILFSIPLGGGQRGALADRAGSEATAARAEATRARFDMQEIAAGDVAEARFRLAAWQRARAALDSQVAALTRLRRGYDLGEIDLSDLLFGERMVHDAFREEALARAEAHRALTKLRIDSHELWLAD
ncbi:TolC family protein [Croceibacterium aestuarii]|uniref:TolC family protein n=1 Tax=Croceibacterium aestuarii TaxID=3064139 RepID=UPI00272E7CDA|nr:TolC family protein [Croceibacterium sp. D39]